MEYSEFRYDFTMRELGYFLFAKKVCPRCSGKLKKEKSFEIVPCSQFSTKSHRISGTRKVKHYFYSYTCTTCGLSFPLSELANKKR